MPGACEALGVERGVLMSELTGTAFHVAHMSAARLDAGGAKGEGSGCDASRAKWRRITSR